MSRLYHAPSVQPARQGPSHRDLQEKVCVGTDVITHSTHICVSSTYTGTTNIYCCSPYLQILPFNLVHRSCRSCHAAYSSRSLAQGQLMRPLNSRCVFDVSWFNSQRNAAAKITLICSLDPEGYADDPPSPNPDAQQPSAAEQNNMEAHARVSVCSGSPGHCLLVVSVSVIIVMVCLVVHSPPFT
jgi:hypothetical protein